MLAYTEHRGYSPTHDCEMVRLSMADEHGAEYWMEIPAAEGKRWRERRDEALDAIEQAMAEGCPPGEVRIG